MIHKLEISIDIIVHATEDTSKILQALQDVLGLDKNNFAVEQTDGHYKNPITMLSADILKEQAQSLMKRLRGGLPARQVEKLTEEIEERIADSRLYLRLGKQELLGGELVLMEGGTIKLRIHTPVYNKRDTVRIFSEIFQTD